MNPEDVVIILSDDDDVSINDSVCIVEDIQNHVYPVDPSNCSRSHDPEGEEDLVVTFCQRGEVLPHARYDCTAHTFTPTDSDVGGPIESNQLFCHQCFCYVCDKVASECSVWTVSGVCHCNAHKRSVFWSNKRDKVVLGYLQMFNFNLLEIDSDLRLAESLLLQLEEELSKEYASFQRGVAVRGLAVQCACHCHTANRLECGNCQSNHLLLLVYDYSQVFECVCRFLGRAERERPRAAAVMRLGAAQLFITHCQPPGPVISHHLEARIAEALPLLLTRVMEAVRRQMVECDFSPEFLQKLQGFYQTLPLPPSCIALRNRLCVLPWSDVLLVSVLKGQNVTGIRPGKGKKEPLTESAAVVLLRTETLQRLNSVQAVRDLIPLFLMKAGDFSSALSSFFYPPPGVCCPVCRLTPRLFTLYLRIITTATAPSVTAAIATQPLSPDTPWEEVKGAVVPRQVEVVKFGLRVLKSNMAVYKDSQSWAYFLHVLNSPAGPPDTAFLTEARNVTMEILLNQGSLGHLIQIPRTFLMVYPDQALLLLVTQALALRILHEPLTPALPVLNYYKGHVWALRWLVGFLSSSPGRLESFLRGVAVELHNTDGSQLSPSSFPSSSLKDQPDPFWHYYLTDFIRETLSVIPDCSRLDLDQTGV
ncbi:uncharacterized protein LOC110517923 isoform X1 [Oncorhynchus mykiss]|uniref:uncharacterized protein LOC110517923 isoform X1 n=1 Tax=Oncorhynchus mykiss TaxID=8022 RepID=UPI0018781A40|nr:uncharacterized protein LOC110517923 isoform X1 [Oncorhynchus mykiss]